MMSPSLRATAWLALIAVCCGQAQPFGPGALLPTSGADVRVDANLVLVPVTVTDNRGAVISDLKPGNFVLAEEKQSQAIVSFAHETAPISLGIVVDLSHSIAGKLASVQLALETLLDSLEPEDEAFLVTFADTPQLRSPFTADPSRLRGALAFAEPRGSTALFDAVALAARQMHAARHRRRVLFLISDGGDNHSRLSERELHRLLDEEDLQIHAIGVHCYARKGEAARGRWILEALAQLTGGQHQTVGTDGQLASMVARISLALHEAYVLGYKPTLLGGAGKFRRIEVKVVRPVARARLSVYARRGYRVP